MVEGAEGAASGLASLSPSVRPRPCTPTRLPRAGAVESTATTMTTKPRAHGLSKRFLAQVLLCAPPSTWISGVGRVLAQTCDPVPSRLLLPELGAAGQASTPPKQEFPTRHPRSGGRNNPRRGAWG